MLVLTRPVGTSLRIGTQVVVTILSVDPDTAKVRVGVTAPPEIAVLRQEAKVKGPRKRGGGC